MEGEFFKLKQWLNLTNQQYFILTAIYGLQQSSNSKPKDIEVKYREISGKLMQKTNLFGLLKLLLDRRYIIKDEKMNYRLNINAIKEKLELEKRRIKTQAEEISSCLESPNNLLNILDRDNKDSIYVNLIEMKEFYDKISTKLNLSEEYYNISRFPSLFFTESMSKRIHRNKYIDVLRKECFFRKRLKISYLTNLDISRVYNHSLKILNDRKQALRETELVIQNFSSTVESNEKLFIYYSEIKPDWEFVIPYADIPRELFLILRSKDATDDSNGILHIISKDVSEKAFRIINERINKAERVTDKNIQSYVIMLKRELNRIKNRRQSSRQI